MKCLRKFKWIKLRRNYLPDGRGLLGYWARLAARAAFRKGKALYCGHKNEVVPGMWSGGIVGLKSILGVKRRSKALQIMNELQELGYYKVVDEAKKNNIPIRYFSFASPNKCAEQFVQEDKKASK